MDAAVSDPVLPLVPFAVSAPIRLLILPFDALFTRTGQLHKDVSTPVRYLTLHYLRGHRWVEVWKSEAPLGSLWLTSAPRFTLCLVASGGSSLGQCLGR
jgi:hypothetical protein